MRIKDLEKSVLPNSIIYTDTAGVPKYVDLNDVASKMEVIGTIEPTPTPTGNTTNLNSVFKDANGDTWIVDGDGNAILTASTVTPSTVVLDNLITDPTTITDPGRYIVPATGGTGVFVGQANKYADFDGTNWTFETPATGDRVDINFGPNAGNIYSFNGTVWSTVVSTVNDFWRSGAGGTTLPDGTNDFTENIRRNGFTGLNVDPLSTFDDNGSIGIAGTNTTAATYTAAPTDSVIYLNSSTAQTLNLPTASSATRRIYTIVNPTGATKVISTHTTLQGTTSTTILPFSSTTIQSDSNIWKQIDGEQYTGVSSVPVIVAKGRVNIGDPISIGAKTVTNSVNIAGATGLDNSTAQGRLQINFTSALSSVDYIISGELVSQNVADWNNNDEIIWTVVSKSITNFVISFKQFANVVQSLFFDFQIHQAGVNTSTAYVAGAGIDITNSTISAVPTTLSGNIIAIGEKYPSLTEITFGNLKMRWNAPSNRIEIATVTGTESLEWTTMIVYGNQSTIINGGGGVDATVLGTPITATTTFQIIGDPGLVDVENRYYNIWTNTGKHYRVNVLRKGTTATNGWVSFVVEEIGVTSSQIYTPGEGININSGVVSRKYESGDVIQTRVYSGTAAINWNNVAFITRSVNLPTITPKSTTSKIVIELDADFFINGSNIDQWRVEIFEGATLLYDKRQRMGIATGETGRNSVLLPLMLVVSNNTLSTRTFNFRVNRVSGDDTIQFYDYRSLKITEVQD